MHYFTITAGRTGTAWLASFFSENLKIDAVHEHLGINDLGEKMPDIRTLRNFNNFGNNDYVQNFWNKKFEGIPSDTLWSIIKAIDVPILNFFRSSLVPEIPFFI